MKILFAIIIVPMLTVAVLRQYLQHLWAKKEDGESPGFTNFNIFDTINELRNIFWPKSEEITKMSYTLLINVTDNAMLSLKSENGT